MAMQVSMDLLAALQSQQERVRNLCIMAHVDHGKTSLSDHLIGSNGLIHPKLQGELRYLDSREDEQQRGITMKASSISLLYVPGAATRPEGPKSLTPAEKLSSGYLVNLIDSPGHVDFCSEVSTAARLSDGALVVVDAVEGVRIQTHAVLRQAYEEKVRPVLVINKLDRLILELRLSPEEAYERLRDIVGHANMVLSGFASERYLREADAVLAVEARHEAAAHARDDADGDGAAASAPGAQEQGQQGQGGAGHEAEDEADAFNPVLGTVAFGSAADGWAFRLDQFAEMYAEKLGCKAEGLVRALWGDWAFSPKDKRVVKVNRSKSTGAGRLKPMFVQFALEPIWKAYSVCPGGDSAGDAASVLGAIVRSRGLGGQVASKVLEQADARQAVKAVMRAWLPLSEAVLGMAARNLPSPAAAAPLRASRLLGCAPGSPPPPGLPPVAAAELAHLEACLAASDASPYAPLVIYVSKMVSVPANLLPRAPGDPHPAASGADEVFLAFGRVFSGTARPGQRVHVLGAAYSPAAPASRQRQSAVLGPLYMMMGRALERLSQVPAGNVLAIAGLGTAVLKSATISSTPACRPLAPLLFQAAPIVQVAVEPAHPSEMPRLVAGLQLLNRADPFVEISVLSSGEHVLGAAGEVHLGTCVKDLQERFAKIELRVSAPLVAFRESVFYAPEAPEGVALGGPVGGLKGARVVEAVTPNGVACVRVRALALPAGVAAALDSHSDLLRRVLLEGEGTQAQAQQEAADAPSTATATSSVAGELAALREQLLQAAGGEGSRAWQLLQRAWLLGPRRTGPNLLLVPSAKAGQQQQGQQQGPCGQQQQPGGLFDVPHVHVVRAARAAAGTSAGTGTGAGGAAGAGGEAAAAAEADHHQQAAAAACQVTLRVGSAAAAVALGLVSGDEAAADQGEASVDARVVAGAADAARVAAAAEGEAASAAAATPQQQRQHACGSEAGGSGVGGSSVAALEALEHVVAGVESGLLAGFQMATASGPLCEEPMWGVAFELEVRLKAQDPAAAAHRQQQQQHGAEQEQQQQQEAEAGGSGRVASLDLQEDVYGPFSGQVMTTMALACRRAVIEAEPRLVEAMYLGQTTASAEALSGMYAVLGRRRARILREEMKEGSDTFLVSCYLPVEASFGLAQEMRQRSSGAASASLMLSHWERLQVDPFFSPTTEEEREEHGEDGSGLTNLARRLIDAVRRRKGLPVEEKVVQRATKQRTLKRNV